METLVALLTPIVVFFSTNILKFVGEKLNLLKKGSGMRVVVIRTIAVILSFVGANLMTDSGVELTGVGETADAISYFILASLGYLGNK